ncbi:MAG: transketolase [Thermomicrobiales bacterium]
MAVATDQSLESRAVNAIRGLAIDAIQAANSGHPGMPLGAAPMAFALWDGPLSYNPANPGWADRDRFVLSGGHGSMLLYALLYLTGYDVSLDDLKAFRKLGSKTPGHPELGHTPGVEVTTGPLGQGFANGVGMAIAEAWLAATYNRPGHDIVNHFTYGIVTDGDIQEGVCAEAASLAGHLGLGKLIYLYDANQISLAGTLGLSMSEETGARFESYGWQVIAVDGMDVSAVRAAIAAAQADTVRPSLIIARTIIGFGAPKAGTASVHGSPLGAEGAAAAKDALGLAAEPFVVDAEALAHWRKALDRGAAAEAAWQTRWNAYAAAYPAEAKELAADWSGELPAGWDSDLPVWEPGGKVSTRKASGDVIAKFFPKVPNFIGGSADLNPSTLTGMKGAGDFENPHGTPDPGIQQGMMGGDWGYKGRNIHFGIREHAMGSAVNGMAAHGGVIPFGATFHVFSDYCRPAVRLAALSGLRSIFVFTHDSIAVGEDGPTHEPIEQTMSLRLIPGLSVIRPADGNETADAWRSALTHDGPTCLVLSRQDLPVLDQSDARGNLFKGGYILTDTEGDPDVVLIGAGSEVELCLGAKEILAGKGFRARVVSLPSWDRFDAQPADYRRSVLGPAGTPRVSVEAGVTTGWQKYTGENGAQVGIDTFGASGNGGAVLKMFGFTKERVAATALHLLGQHELEHEIDPTIVEG